MTVLPEKGGSDVEPDWVAPGAYDPLRLVQQLRDFPSFSNDQAEALFLQLDNSIRVLLWTLSSQHNDLKRLERLVETTQQRLREIVEELQL